jgi:hypothetical protein
MAMIDDRLAFLARASARFTLVMSGDMELDEAFDGLVTAMNKIAPCYCGWETLQRWDRIPPPRPKRPWRAAS